MRVKLNLGGVWGLVSLEFSHPSRQGSWRADRLGPSTGVRSRPFLVTAPFPGSSPASPVPSSPDEPDLPASRSLHPPPDAALCLQRKGPLRCPAPPDSEHPDSAGSSPGTPGPQLPFPREGSLPAGRFRHLLIPTGCPHHVLSVFQSAGD